LSEYDGSKKSKKLRKARSVDGRTGCEREEIRNDASEFDKEEKTKRITKRKRKEARGVRYV
jgi:hypothetical protein